MKTQHEKLMEDPAFRKLYATEGLVTDAAELVARLMARAGVSKAELARRLGKSRAYLTQLLGGRTNMTVRTLAEVAYALGAEVRLDARPHERATIRRGETHAPIVFPIARASLEVSSHEPAFAFGEIKGSGTPTEPGPDTGVCPEYAA